MQIKQRVHLLMKLCDQEGIWKTQLYTDSLSPKIKLPYNNLQNRELKQTDVVAERRRSHSNLHSIKSDLCQGPSEFKWL